MNRRDDHLPLVLPQQVHQFLPTVGRDHVRHVGHVERGRDLRVEVHAVDDDQHRRAAELRVQAQLLGPEDHQQALARALKMPDQPSLDPPGHHALDDLVRRLVLLVPGDDLDLAVLPVSAEHGEMIGQVQQHLGPQGFADRLLHRLQRILLARAPGVPRTPLLNRHPHRPVAVLPAVGRETEDGRGEHLRHVFLVIVADVRRPVDPRDRGPHRRLGLADHKRQPVHKEHDVEAPLHLAHRRGAERPLAGHHQVVRDRIVVIDEPHGRVLAPLAEGHGLLVPDPCGERLVGPHQAVALYAQGNGPKAVEHLIGPVRLGGDLRIEPHQGLADHRLDHHVTGLPLQVLCRHIPPAQRLAGVDDHLLNGVAFVEWTHVSPRSGSVMNCRNSSPIGVRFRIPTTPCEVLRVTSPRINPSRSRSATIFWTNSFFPLNSENAP